MAKGKKRRATKRKRRKGLGNLKQTGFIRDLVPSAVGTVTALGTTIGIRAALTPTPGTTQETVYNAAPWLGAGAGLLGAMFMYAVAGPSQATATAVHALVVGGSLWGLDKIAEFRGRPMAAVVPPAEGVARLGNVVVPELGRTRRLGATVLETVQGTRGLQGNEQGQGHVVQLQGTVQADAFGKKAYG